MDSKHLFPSDDDVGECADALAHGLVALARLQELLQGHEAVAVQVHLLKRERRGCVVPNHHYFIHATYTICFFSAAG